MGRSKTKVLVDSLSSEGPLSALWSAAFSLYPLVVEVGVRLCMSLLTRTLLVSGPQPYDSFLTLITSLYALSPNTVILGVKTGYSENQFIMWVVGWGGFSHNTNNSWTSAGCPTIQLRSTQFWHYLPRESIQSHGLSVQFVILSPPPPLQTPVTKPCAFDHQATDWRFWKPPAWTCDQLAVIRGSQDSPSGSVDLLEQFREFGETFYLLNHWFIVKECSLRTTR